MTAINKSNDHSEGFDDATSESWRPQIEAEVAQPTECEHYVTIVDHSHIAERNGQLNLAARVIYRP